MPTLLSGMHIVSGIVGRELTQEEIEAATPSAGNGSAPERIFFLDPCGLSIDMSTAEEAMQEFMGRLVNPCTKKCKAEQNAPRRRAIECRDVCSEEECHIAGSRCMNTQCGSCQAFWFNEEGTQVCNKMRGGAAQFNRLVNLMETFVSSVSPNGNSVKDRLQSAARTVELQPPHDNMEQQQQQGEGQPAPRKFDPYQTNQQ